MWIKKPPREQRLGFNERSTLALLLAFQKNHAISEQSNGVLDVVENITIPAGRFFEYLDKLLYVGLKLYSGRKVEGDVVTALEFNVGYGFKSLCLTRFQNGVVLGAIGPRRNTKINPQFIVGHCLSPLRKGL